MNPITSPQINHEWSILCSQSIVDTDTNNLSLINLIEQLKLNINLNEGKKFDENEGVIFPLNMVLVSRFHKITTEEIESKCDVKIDFVSPDNKVLGSYEQEIVMAKDVRNIRMRFGITALKFTKTGLYNFVVNCKQKEENTYTSIGNVPLDVFLEAK